MPDGLLFCGLSPKAGSAVGEGHRPTVTFKRQLLRRSLLFQLRDELLDLVRVTRIWFGLQE
jgi:hypothetical protein